jgi:hypothetical protein
VCEASESVVDSVCSFIVFLSFTFCFLKPFAKKTDAERHITPHYVYMHQSEGLNIYTFFWLLI